jgi:hypothetical protein
MIDSDAILLVVYCKVFDAFAFSHGFFKQELSKPNLRTNTESLAPNFTMSPTKILAVAQALYTYFN